MALWLGAQRSPATAQPGRHRAVTAGIEGHIPGSPIVVVMVAVSQACTATPARGPQRVWEIPALPALCVRLTVFVDVWRRILQNPQLLLALHLSLHTEQQGHGARG